MKRTLTAGLAALMLIGLVASGHAEPRFAPIPKAVVADPPRDAAHPADMAVFTVLTGGVRVNAMMYLASGDQPHPTMLMLHGFPGNETNIDLMQAVRRAGWNVMRVNYRGSWGSPGEYRFAQNLEDADAVLAFARDPANAAKLRIDSKRLVIMGHSMGGWVTALTAAHDKQLIGAAMISAANLGAFGKAPRDQLAAGMKANGQEALAGTSPEIMADELIAKADAFDWQKAAPALAATNLFILSSDDGLAPGTDALAKAIHDGGGTKVKTLHVATDHSWSDARIRLQAEVLRWLETLKVKE